MILVVFFPSFITFILSFLPGTPSSSGADSSAKLVETLMSEDFFFDFVDELFKIKDYKFLGDIKYWAHAILCHFDENPDQAIEYINKAIEVDRQWRQDRNYWLMRCYNQKNVNQAIQEGENFLKKPPFDPLIILELSKAYIANGQIENANQNLTKLLGIWEDADEEYIYFQEAKKLWKEINTEKELA